MNTAWQLLHDYKSDEVAGKSQLPSQMRTNKSLDKRLWWPDHIQRDPKLGKHGYHQYRYAHRHDLIGHPTSPWHEKEATRVQADLDVPHPSGGTRPPAITAGPPPPGTGVPGGTEEPSSVIYVELHPLRWHGESKEGKQHQAMGKSRPQQSTIPIAYLHNQSYYIDPNPSAVCFQRQHQGELCPSSHACSNSRTTPTTSC